MHELGEISCPLITARRRRRLYVKVVRLEASMKKQYPNPRDDERAEIQSVYRGIAAERGYSRCPPWRPPAERVHRKAVGTPPHAPAAPACWGRRAGVRHPRWYQHMVDVRVDEAHKLATCGRSDAGARCEWTYPNRGETAGGDAAPPHSRKTRSPTSKPQAGFAWDGFAPSGAGRRGCAGRGGLQRMRTLYDGATTLRRLYVAGVRRNRGEYAPTDLAAKVVGAPALGGA